MPKATKKTKGVESNESESVDIATTAEKQEEVNMERRKHILSTGTKYSENNETPSDLSQEKALSGMVSAIDNATKEYKKEKACYDMRDKKGKPVTVTRSYGKTIKYLDGLSGFSSSLLLKHSEFTKDNGGVPWKAIEDLVRHLGNCPGLVPHGIAGDSSVFPYRLCAESLDESKFIESFMEFDAKDLKGALENLKDCSYFYQKLAVACKVKELHIYSILKTYSPLVDRILGRISQIHINDLKNGQDEESKEEQRVSFLNQLSVVGEYFVQLRNAVGIDYIKSLFEGDPAAKEHFEQLIDFRNHLSHAEAAYVEGGLSDGVKQLNEFIDGGEVPAIGREALDGKEIRILSINLSTKIANTIPGCDLEKIEDPEAVSNQFFAQDSRNAHKTRFRDIILNSDKIKDGKVLDAIQYLHQSYEDGSPDLKIEKKLVSIKKTTKTGKNKNGGDRSVTVCEPDGEINKKSGKGGVENKLFYLRLFGGRKGDKGVEKAYKSVEESYLGRIGDSIGKVIKMKKWDSQKEKEREVLEGKWKKEITKGSKTEEEWKKKIKEWKGKTKEERKTKEECKMEEAEAKNFKNFMAFYKLSEDSSLGDFKKKDASGAPWFKDGGSDTRIGEIKEAIKSNQTNNKQKTNTVTDDQARNLLPALVGAINKASSYKDGANVTLLDLARAYSVSLSVSDTLLELANKMANKTGLACMADNLAKSMGVEKADLDSMNIPSDDVILLRRNNREYHQRRAGDYVRALLRNEKFEQALNKKEFAEMKIVLHKAKSARGYLNHNVQPLHGAGEEVGNIESAFISHTLLKEMNGIVPQLKDIEKTLSSSAAAQVSAGAPQEQPNLVSSVNEPEAGPSTSNPPEKQSRNTAPTSFSPLAFGLDEIGEASPSPSSMLSTSSSSESDSISLEAMA